MSDDIYLQLGIDTSKLKRDYIKNPLKRIIRKTGGIKYELPYKEDLEYLYIELNIPRNKLYKIFNCKERLLKKWLRLFNINKNKNLIFVNITKTLMDRYNCSSPIKNKNIKEKMQNTIFVKYGKKFYSQTINWKNIMNNKHNIIEQKKYETLKKSGNWGNKISKQEILIGKLLKIKMPNIIYQYKSERYPFVCDFYNPDSDTFIEYQGYFTHGGEPYIGSNEQKEKVKLWESKNTSQYKKAIDTWTIRDPLKRKIAKENNLNYLEFFNMDEFMGWYNNQ